MSVPEVGHKIRRFDRVPTRSTDKDSVLLNVVQQGLRPVARLHRASTRPSKPGPVQVDSERGHLVRQSPCSEVLIGRP